jgi:hypothetical protein
MSNLEALLLPEKLTTIQTVSELTDQMLKIIEDNYTRYLESNITHHRYLLEIAEKEGDLQRTMHHRVLLETFETMLANHRLSCRYSSA